MMITVNMSVACLTVCMVFSYEIYTQYASIYYLLANLYYLWLLLKFPAK